MKIHAFASWKVVGAALLIVTVVRAPADPASTASKVTMPGKNYTGIVSCVDTNEHIFQIKRPLLPARQFAYGDNCEITFLYTMLRNGGGTSGDLRPGEKVTVSYQDSHGVNITGRIEQQPMQFSGTVKDINPQNHTLTLRRWILDRRLNVAPDCIAVLDDKPGTLADIHSGDQVVVTYETPGGHPTAWQITKTRAATLGKVGDQTQMDTNGHR